MSTPPGWYTDPDDPSRQRYWDGTSWTENRTEPAAAQPAPAQPAPAAAATVMPATAPQQSHTARNIILAIIAVVVLLLGGCIAVVALTVNEVDQAIDEIEADDSLPGGPDNPLEITVGEAFEVQDFNYDAGWSVDKDFAGDLAIKGLKVTNNRDDTDGAIVEIRFMDGNELVALADCTTPQIDPGQTVAVDCFSADKFPNSYDTVTINDTF